MLVRSRYGRGHDADHPEGAGLRDPGGHPGVLGVDAVVPDVQGGRDGERAADGGRTDVGLARGVDRGAAARDGDLSAGLEVGPVDIGGDRGAHGWPMSVRSRSRSGSRRRSPGRRWPSRPRWSSRGSGRRRCSTRRTRWTGRRACSGWWSD